MKRFLEIAAIAFIFGGMAKFINASTVNPASRVTADSDSTANTIVYRDDSANFAAATITANTVSATLAPTSKTKAQLQAMTPSAAGLVYYCSNCSVSTIVVSTGTSLDAFADSQKAAIQ